MNGDLKTTQYNDSALTCRAIAGDRQALEQLLRKNWAWMRTVVRAYARQFSDIEDILQNVCLRIMLNIHTLREPERFRPWVATITRREAMAYLRKTGRTALRETTLDESSLPQPENTGTHNQDLNVQQAILNLPDKYRQVLLLKYFNDCSYDEIAEILDTTANTVQMRLYRARKMVAEQLENKTTSNNPRGES